MVKNYLKVMIRNMLKYKAYLTINILGLTIAITCSLLAISLITDEFTFDQFHAKKDRIYRLNNRKINITTGLESRTAETSGLMGPTMASEFPEIEQSVRIAPWFDDVVISKDDRNFRISNLVFADSNFFSVFDFKLLRGDASQVLSNPSSLVITESLAERLFRKADPMGEIVIGINDLEMTITGIVEDPPRNSHIQYDVLASWSTTVPGVGPLAYTFLNNWLGQTVLTYLLLKPDTDIKRLEAKFEPFMLNHFPQRADSYFLYLQSFEKIYLYSANLLGTDRHLKIGNATFLQIFGIIAAFILLIACINYININTAKATKRAAEVGIRKVMGAQKIQLIGQFIGESFIMVLLSTLLGLFVADLALPFFNQLTGKSIQVEMFFSIQMIASVGIMLVVVSIMAGMYPAMVISGFNPVKALKSSGRNYSVRSKSRQVLTVLQFIISISLISATIAINQQTTFLSEKELGFNKNQVLVVNTNNSIKDNHASFKIELLEHPNILSVSICQAAIGSGNFGTTVIPEGMAQEMSTQVFRVEKDFINTYEMEIIEGREFDINEPVENYNLIVNETFVKMAGWENPIQRKVRFNSDGPGYPVVGVVNDFNYMPITDYEVDPIVMAIVPRFTNASIRISTQEMAGTLDYIRSVYNKYESRHPFDYFFVDHWFDNKYKTQEKLLGIIAVFSVISILVAFLGLYGLTSFTIEQKTREIGIRKIFGASVTSITLMINQHFIILVLLAFIVASPIAYYFLQDWLNGFVYRVNLDYWIFIASGVVTLLIAVSAVSIQALKAALSNPVKSLGHE